MPKRARADIDSDDDDDGTKTACRWCSRLYFAQGMHRHETACMANPAMHKQRRVELPLAPHNAPRKGPEPLPNPVRNALNDGDAAPMITDDSPPPVNDDEDEEQPDADQRAYPMHGPQLPREFIRVDYHDNSGQPPRIISLDPDMPDAPLDDDVTGFPGASQSEQSPWAPFASRADFEFAEAMATAQASKKTVNMILDRLHGSWSRNGSNVSFRTYRDMEKALDAAREFITDFEEGSVTIEYAGQQRTTKFLYRNPWTWIQKLVKDPVLWKTHTLHSSRKFYCRRDSPNDDRLIDETSTANRWWWIETALGKGHFLLPMHLWLDQGKVSNKVKMHPMVLRALWQPACIHNASGNGGGLLMGFMEILQDPLNPESDVESDDFAFYKRQVYNAVFGYMFRDCVLPSHIGRLMRCGDGLSRTFHPEVLIESLDGQEAAHFTQVRGATAYHPYINCLVHKDDLSKLECRAPRRTVALMKQVYEEAEAAPPTRRNQILVDNGLHPIRHFLWDFRHSDPYQAFGCDPLHKYDLGTFGKHVWPLLRALLKDRNLARTVNHNASLFPIVPGLQHFGVATKTVCDIDFSDGETFFSIAKIIRPCIVQVMPSNSSLVQWLGYYIAFRIIIGLKCVSASQQDYLQGIIAKYEEASTRVSRDYDKNFNFFKQHSVAHAPESVRELGVVENQSTRPGEGFIQEVRQQYKRTNGRDAVKQMTKQDSWGEVVAEIRTAVDTVDAQAVKVAEAAEEAASSSLPTGALAAARVPRQGPKQPSRFGSPLARWEYIEQLEQRLSEAQPAYNRLEYNLRQFIERTFSRFKELRGNIMVLPHQCGYIEFASVEDYRPGRDIVRCTPSWHGKPRFDCVLFDDGRGASSVHKPLRLRALFQCKIMSSGDILEVAAVSRFTPCTWRPKTKYRGLRVFEERSDIELVDPAQFIRMAIMCPAFGSPRASIHYLEDSAGDGDMFLRLNNLAVTNDA